MKTPPIPTFQLPSYVYKATVVKVVDADTIDVRLDVGFDTHVFKRLRFLLVDAWETRGEEREKGLAAKEYVIQRFNEVDNKNICPNRNGRRR